MSRRVRQVPPKPLDAEADAIVEKYRKRPKPCIVSTNPYKDLIEALILRGVTDDHIQTEMDLRKAHITDSTIRRHRLKECGCDDQG